MITFEQIFENEQIKTYIRKADDALRVLGFTEHSFAHVGKVARQARDILLTLEIRSVPPSWRRLRAICTTSAM